MIAIETENLSFSYKEGEHLLKDVSIQIREGDMISVIGPNGYGKTTLLKLFAGMLTPQSGSISIFGKPPIKQRELIAYVPQALFFDRKFPITAKEVVLSGRLQHLNWLGKFPQKEKNLALDALDAMQLLEYKDAPIAALSGGQLQRVLLARALVQRPKILLLDEPTASVDPEAVSSIVSLLHHLQKQHKMTIIMVTHNLNDIINHVQNIICVQESVTCIHPDTICEHFALGLYHYPLVRARQDHPEKKIAWTHFSKHS